MQTREIKFKFWLGHIKKMTYSHTISEIGKIIPEFTSDIIPLQSTGLLDKNGKEIYEGDIVSVPYVTPVGELTDDENYRASVIYKNGSFQHHGYSNKTFYELSCWCKTGKKEYVSNVGEVTELLDTTVLTIIGNVYENPELLNP